MKFGLIGLGRMGMSIAHRVIAAGHEVVAFDPNPMAGEQAAALGARVVTCAADVAKATPVIWLMIPAGELIDNVIAEIRGNLSDGGIIVDGGNSWFKDSVRRARELAAQGINFLDCGTSGGLQGERIGFSLMIGGNAEAFVAMEQFFKAIAAPGGYAHLGPSGAGHYVKMVHNGIEYSVLQAYAEGIHLLHDGEYKHLDLAQVTQVWQHGSILRSWINELLHEVLAEDAEKIDTMSGAIGENLTGRWTLDEAEEHNVPMRLLNDALEIRAESRSSGGNFATKIVALLRNKFGGHAISKK